MTDIHAIAKTLKKKIEDILGDKLGNISYVKFKNDSFMPLVIESIGRNTYAITHYFEQNGDLLPDPDIEFYLQDDGLYPLAIQDPLHYARVGSVESGKLNIDKSDMVDLINFCDFWFTNLKNQGFDETKIIRKENTK